ncbi:MAG: hypothetical protein AB7F59_10145 [Bdellovibrionales bacterium]
MTQKRLILFVFLMFPALLKADETNALSPSEKRASLKQELEESEQNYKLRKQEVSRAKAERQRGLEQHLRKKEWQVWNKERARKAYVEQQYGRKPASEEILKHETAHERRLAYQRYLNEKARIQHLEEIDKQRKIRQTVRKKYRTPATYLRDHQPWNE